MDKNSVILKSFQGSDAFKGLTLEQYDSIIKSGFRKTLQPKSILFRQGDPAKACFLINQGRLKLTKLNDQGKEVIIRYVSAGELTAAVALLKDWNYHVTAEAVEMTELTGWEKQILFKLMRNFPDVAINILCIILERLADVQERYLELSTERVEQRIARTLLRLMRSTGAKTSEGISIDISLSRQNIADYSGTTLYTVSRTLSAWEKNGWIKSGREQIVITDPHAMVQFAETG